MEYIKETMG